MRKLGITLTVKTDDPEVYTRATEAMSRTLAALAMEGADPMIYVSAEDDDA